MKLYLDKHHCGLKQTLRKINIVSEKFQGSTTYTDILV